ncbi:MAG: protoheme IX farnesyltransferase [Flavobacteriales bacterium]|nr:protoheme IX farnesyltransferase [Flavobacteriales bacterium]
MSIAKTHVSNPTSASTFRIKDLVQLIKLRLTLLVVFSAGIGYLFGAIEPIVWSHLAMLLLSGFLITGSANGINQILEKDLDKLMSRTADRPVATGRMQVRDATVVTATMGIAGVAILSLFMNNIAALLGLFSLLSYAFVYTPMKRTTAFAVLAGAFPGAMPTVIGYVAITGNIDLACIALFMIQFVWQFPHFWSIAWILDEDYKKAGFQLLPLAGLKDKRSGFVVFLSALLLIPLSIFPIGFDIISMWSGLMILVCSLAFLYAAYKLYVDCDAAAAKRLMFGSIIYLPIVQILLVLGRL